MKRRLFIVSLCVWLLGACGSSKSGIDPFRPGADVSVTPQVGQSVPTAAPPVEIQPVSPTTASPPSAPLSSAPRPTTLNVAGEGSAVADLDALRIAGYLAWLLFIAFTRWLTRKAFAVSAAIQLLNVIVLGLLVITTYVYQPREFYWLTAIFLFSACAFVWSCYQAILERKRRLAFESDGLADSRIAKAEGGTRELA